MNQRIRRRSAVVTASLVATAALAVAATPAVASGSNVPFTDPSQHGYIALCDLAGHNVTSGSTTSRPMVWKAVSSTPAPAAFTGYGQNAGLLIFQPRRGVAPADWNGDLLTGATLYKSKAAPVSEATYKDFSLADFVKEFPSQWDGLYQLRMHYAKRGYGTYSSTYPAAVIQVTGKTWHVVQGGTLPCGSSSAGISTEVEAGIHQVDPHHSSNETPTSAAAPQQASSTRTASNTSASGGSTGGDHVITSALNSPAKPDPAGSSDTATIVVAAVAGVVIAALVVALVSRRRPGAAR